MNYQYQHQHHHLQSQQRTMNPNMGMPNHIAHHQFQGPPGGPPNMAFRGFPPTQNFNYAPQQCQTAIGHGNMRPHTLNYVHDGQNQMQINMAQRRPQNGFQEPYQGQRQFSGGSGFQQDIKQNQNYGPIEGYYQPHNQKVFKFVLDIPSDQNMSSREAPQIIHQIVWSPGVNSEMIQMEIKRISGINFQPGNINIGLLPYMVIYDQQEVPVLLNEEMNFDIVYRVKFELPQANSAINNCQTYQYTPNNGIYQPTQNGSLLYSPTTLGGTSLFKSPNIGESYSNFKGFKNNWQQHQQDRIKSPSQASSHAMNVPGRPNQIMVMPSFGPTFQQQNNNSHISSVQGSGALKNLPQKIKVPEPKHDLDNLCDITESLVDIPLHHLGGPSLTASANKSNIIEATMCQQNLQPFSFKNKQRLPDNTYFNQGETSGMLTMRQHGTTTLNLTNEMQLPYSARQMKTQADQYFENLYSQINLNNQNIGRRIEESRRFDEQVLQQKKAKNEEVKQPQSATDPQNKGFQKVLNNTLCGLSNINKDSMDNDSFDEGQVSNAFQKNEMSQSNFSQVPSSLNSNINKNKNEERNQQQQKAIKDKKNNISIELAQQIVKQTQIFDEKQKLKLQVNSTQAKKSIEKCEKQQSIQRVSSLRIQDNLLQHVITNGFKEGFTKQKKDSQKESSETKKSSMNNVMRDSSQLTINFELKQHTRHDSQYKDQSPQLLNELKYNSPQTIKKQQEDEERKRGKKIVNINGLIFPAYDSGKFYKNNEDVILKAKIQKLEQEQLKQQKIDPQKLADQKKKDEVLAQKLISLSPYSRAQFDRSKVNNQALLAPLTKTPKVEERKISLQRVESKGEAKTPPPQQKKPELTDSPLGIVMKKIGLQIGQNTGVNLNKLIQKKPSGEGLVIKAPEAKSVAPVTPIQPKKEMNSKHLNAVKKREQDESKSDTVSNIEEKPSSAGYRTPMAAPKSKRNLKVMKVLEVFRKSAETDLDQSAKYDHNTESKSIMIDNESEINTSLVDKKKKETEEPQAPANEDDWKTPLTKTRKLKKDEVVVDLNRSDSSYPSGPGYPARQQEKSMSDISTIPKTPPPQYRKLKNQDHNPSPHTSGKESNSSYPSAPGQEARKKEGSVSDISNISRTPPPNFRTLFNKEKIVSPWGKRSNSSSHSHVGSLASQPRHSYRRKMEQSKSDISQLEKSPFLKLIKEPLGQIAGTPFEFVQERVDPNIKKIVTMQYNGSFVLRNDSIINSQGDNSDNEDEKDEDVDQMLCPASPNKGKNTHTSEKSNEIDLKAFSDMNLDTDRTNQGPDLTLTQQTEFVAVEQRVNVQKPEECIENNSVNGDPIKVQMRSNETKKPSSFKNMEFKSDASDEQEEQ